jgi:hypothetical protein
MEDADGPTPERGTRVRSTLVGPELEANYRPLMVVPTIVSLLCGVVVLVGGGAELRDTVRAGRAPALVPAAAPDAPERAVEDGGRWPLLAWFGLAAFTVLGAASIADRRPDIHDLTFVVLLLGFAGERAFYLVRRKYAGGDRALGGEIVACVVGALGLLVGLTS